MDAVRIAELLQPFSPRLAPNLAERLHIYLQLLLRWNERINLTSVREPEQIVTRHFGESLFAAHALFDGDRAHVSQELESTGGPSLAMADVGSGAGFPGIPIKLFVPQIRLTLIESQSRKATFLREVIRILELNDANVFSGRAENWGQTADLITLRAVERFQQILPVAATLVAPRGRLCLLIGVSQVDASASLLGRGWRWQSPKPIPNSTSRVAVVGNREPKPESQGNCSTWNTD